MGENSKIQWTTHSWNCWRGCAKVSCGCANCYAWRESKRFPRVRGVWGADGTRVVPVESTWREPAKWDRAAAAAGERHRVFCASLADWLEDWPGHVVDHNERPMYEAPSGVWVPEGLGSPVHDRGWRPLTLPIVRGRLLRLIAATPNLEWLLLTKRPEGFCDRLDEVVREDHSEGGVIASYWLDDDPPPNVRVGASVEDAARFAERVPALREIPGPNFLSVEPLLGDLGTVDLAGVDWVIVGGESGPGARPCDLAWIRSVRDHCRAAGVPCFVKQLGARAVDAPNGVAGRHLPVHPDAAALVSLRLRDSHGGDWSEWPADLRVREMPAATGVAS